MSDGDSGFIFVDRETTSIGDNGAGLLKRLLQRRSPCDLRSVLECVRRHPESCRMEHCFEEGVTCYPLWRICQCRPSREVLVCVYQAYPEAIFETSQGMLPLHAACAWEASLEVIQSLVEWFPESIQHQDVKGGNFPLHIACHKHASLPIVQWLLHQFPDSICIPTRDNGWWPLHVACKKEAPLPVIQYLLKCSPESVQARDSCDMLPLHWVVCCGQQTNGANSSSEKAVQILLSQYPQSVEEPDAFGRLPLHWACARQASVGVIEILLQAHRESREAALSRQDQVDGKFPLHLACAAATPSLPTIRVIARAYPSAVTAEDESGMLPLHWACAKQASSGVIDELLHHAPHAVKATDHDGWLPLHWSLSFSNANTNGNVMNRGQILETIQRLVQAYPEGVRTTQHDGWLPLHLAYKYRAPPAVINYLTSCFPEAAYQQDYAGRLPMDLSNAAMSHAARLQTPPSPAPNRNSNSSRNSAAHSGPQMLQLLSVTDAASLDEDALCTLVRQDPGLCSRQYSFSEGGAEHPLLRLCRLLPSLPTIQLVYEAYPDALSIPNDQGWLPLHVACCNSRNSAYDADGGAAASIVEFLAEWYHDATKKESPMGTGLPLHLACKHGAPVGVVRALCGAYPQALTMKNQYGALPLHVACAFAAPLETVDSLLQLAPETIKVPDAKKLLPLHVACISKSALSVVQKLLDYYPDSIRERATRHGSLPLHLACGWGAPVDIIQELVERYPQGAKEREKRTKALPLHIACQGSIIHGGRNNSNGRSQQRCVSLSVVQFLILSYPEAVKLITNKDKTPLQLAQEAASAVFAGNDEATVATTPMEHEWSLVIELLEYLETELVDLSIIESTASLVPAVWECMTTIALSKTECLVEDEVLQDARQSLSFLQSLLWVRDPACARVLETLAEAPSLYGIGTATMPVELPSSLTTSVLYAKAVIASANTDERCDGRDSAPISSEEVAALEQAHECVRVLEPLLDLSDQDWNVTLQTELSQCNAAVQASTSTHDPQLIRRGILAQKKLEVLNPLASQTLPLTQEELVRIIDQLEREMMTLGPMDLEKRLELAEKIRVLQERLAANPGGQQGKSSPSPDPSAVEPKPPIRPSNKAEPIGLYDRLVVFQSAPLAYTNQRTNRHHAIPLLDYGLESKILEDALRAAVEIGAEVDIDFETATTNRFAAFFARGDCRVMHLSCHGHPDFLVLEDGWGGVLPLKVEDLKRFMAVGGGTLQVVFVSACYSEAAAKAFLEAGVGHVVCCRQDQRLRDQGALEFAKNFYLALAYNNNLKAAFDIAREAVRVSPMVKDARVEVDKFLLLPERPDDDSYHDVPVFFTDKQRRQLPKTKETLRILPQPPSCFVGREVDMYKILSALRTADVVHLRGPSGIGKTSLAAAVCQYIVARKSTFLFDDVMWLPHPGGRAIKSGDAVYEALCQIFTTLRKSRNSFVHGHDDDASAAAAASFHNTNNDEPWHRVVQGLHKKRIMLVVDARSFASPSAMEQLARFVNELFDIGDPKVLMLTDRKIESASTAIGNDGGRGRRGTFSSRREDFIEVEPLDFFSSALLFGKLSNFVSKRQRTHVHTAEEFANLLSPWAGARNEVNGQEQTQDVQPVLSCRRKSLFQMIGMGIPAQIHAATCSMTEQEFEELIRIAKRDEFTVTSRAELEGCIRKKTIDWELAIESKHYLEARDLQELLKELESLRSEFPTLSELLHSQDLLHAELEEAQTSKDYTNANKLVQQLEAIRRQVEREESHTAEQSIGDDYSEIMTLDSEAYSEYQTYCSSNADSVTMGGTVSGRSSSYLTRRSSIGSAATSYYSESATSYSQDIESSR